MRPTPLWSPQMELRNIWTHGEPSQPSQDRMKSEGIKALDVANHIANIEMRDFLEIAYWRMGTQTEKLGCFQSPASLWRCPLRYYWSSCCRPSSLRNSRQAINIWAVPNCSTSFWPLAKATVQSKRSMLKDLALGDLSRWQRCYMGCKGSRWHPLPYSGSLTIPNLFCWLRQQYKASITQKEEERAALKTSKKGRIGLCIHLLCSEQSCG